MEKTPEDSTPPVRVVDPRFYGCYQVRLSRTTARRWGILEWFDPRAQIVEIAEAQAATFTIEQLDLVHPWQPAGQVAAQAGRLWTQASQTPGAYAHFTLWSQNLHRLVRTGRFGDPFDAEFYAMLTLRTQWVPDLMYRRAIIRSWILAPDLQHAFPWPAVYFSSLYGTMSGQLRVCRSCETGLLVARHAWDHTCLDCKRAKQLRRRPAVARAIDRIRKGPDGAHRAQEAIQALRHLSIPVWRTEYDIRRGPQGRKST
jgi:hypothetical protein